MKVILANKFYYLRGGDCIYTIELEKLLKENGHQVAVFSQNFRNNIDNEYSNYWPSGVDYSRKNFSSIKETLFRPIHSEEVKRKFTALITAFKPDIVHLNNIHSQLSPIIATISHKRRIPVFWTLHDYKLLCPAYSCLRNGQNCELCFTNKVNVIKHGCVKNRLGSSIAYLESLRWNKKLLEKVTNTFLAPSNFMRQKMIQGGYNENNIRVLSNFLADYKFSDRPSVKENYYLYVGRLSSEKGIEILLEAANTLPYKLKVVGTGPLQNHLINKYRSKSIEYTGFKEWPELKEIIKKAQFTVIPSITYENNPFALLESFALGTPVLGAKNGGIPELIEINKTGMLFESGNVKDLKNKIKFFFKSSNVGKFGRYAIDYAKRNFTAAKHYTALIELYQNSL